MSADFWAGYVSGGVGILIGNPLDITKVRLQARASPKTTKLPASKALLTGTAAPILGYGALNAILFMSYNRSEVAINRAFSLDAHNLWTSWAAGALGGLATWVVSTPTELIKCRAQVTVPSASSWQLARRTVAVEGIRGLYYGGTVTALRDSIGYGFYFWSYEIANRLWPFGNGEAQDLSTIPGATKVLICGGIAGVTTWASVFPLDVIKTRVQTQQWLPPAKGDLELPNDASPAARSGAIHSAKTAFHEGGYQVFFRGLGVCSLRAFIVNAVQWAVYETIMRNMAGRDQR